jgi:purine-nucleoside phosphorylase
MSDATIAETQRFLRERIPGSPAAILVLGSGLGGAAEEIVDATRIPYSEIPGFPRSTVSGHAGALIAGRWGGVEVVAMAGRFHLYEGWTEAEVALPIRALAALGPRLLVVTNAAGGLRPGMRPGDLMLITDHLNMQFRNPLIGRVAEGEERFPDMSDPYDSGLRAVMEVVALEERIALEQGVYAAVLGPSYETPAEIRMLGALGADAVGMSTVPETIVARARGIRVLGISCITNLAAGLAGHPLSHEEVMDVGRGVQERLSRLVSAALPRLVESAGSGR